MHFLLAHEFRTIEVVGSLEANKGTHCIRRVGLVLMVARLMSTDNPPHAMGVSGEDSGAAEFGLLMNVEVHIVAIGQGNWKR